jgi:hypothetical protein
VVIDRRRVTPQRARQTAAERLREVRRDTGGPELTISGGLPDGLCRLGIIAV